MGHVPFVEATYCDLTYLVPFGFGADFNAKLNDSVKFFCL